MDQPAAEPTAALARIVIPEVVDLEVISKNIGPSIDQALQKAAKLAANITDDASRELAIDAVESLKDECLSPLKRWREEYYRPKYLEAEAAREIFDPRIKQAETVVKTIMGHVADYNVKKQREERLAKERAEAESRRLREDLEQKQRELEAAQRREREAREAEEKRIREAKEAEERRIKAEKEAQERREREARENAAVETARKIKEEEEARLRHAQEAERVGNGPGKVDTILESATPIAPVLARPEAAKDLESLRLQNEQATRVAEEKLLRERAEAEAAEKRRVEAEAETERKRAELHAATEAATAAAAAAATTSMVNAEEKRTVGVTRWVWDLDSDGTEEGDRKAVLELLKAILDSQATTNPVPLEFIGYDPKHPEKFRPSKIGESVSDLKDRFSCPGIRAYCQQDERLKARRTVGGRK